MRIGVMINHAITFVTSPLAVSFALILAGLFLLMRRGKVAAALPAWCAPSLVLIGIGYLWLMSSGLVYCWLGQGLEREFPPQRVEELPQADAIVLLGGGVAANTNTICYTELYLSADRVAHAARIWKAGKAPVILASGTNELMSTRPFLMELGVPADAIRIENESGNTEENARFVSKLLRRNGNRPKVLLVTSAWHMRRALLMFRKYADGIEVVPAACDYEATIGSDETPNFFSLLIPNADCLLRNSYMLKEIIGYWGYRLLR